MTDHLCTCPLLRIGNRLLRDDGPRALREDCPTHGLGTEYYTEVTERHRHMLDQLRRRAEEARNK